MMRIQTTAVLKQINPIFLFAGALPNSLGCAWLLAWSGYYVSSQFSPTSAYYALYWLANSYR